MLDAAARALAQILYFLLWSVALLLWELNRALAAIAILIHSIHAWLLENIGYFVQAVINALEGPLAIMFVLAIAALGFWYLLNSLVATQKFVEPSKLLTNGLLILFFFGSPLIVIEFLEEARSTVMVDISETVLSNASGDMLGSAPSGTDGALPPGAPDFLQTGRTDSFDLAGTFLLVSNVNEFANIQFPAEFEAAYFSRGDPTTITLTDEADREQALAEAWDGIRRLGSAILVIPSAIAEYLLLLTLTLVAVLLYIGAPFAMLLAFFVYTQAFFAAYVRQFIHLIIETFISMVILAVMMALLMAASQQGIGLYIGASIVSCAVIIWRIKSAFKLAMNAADLFGGASVTGGSSGRELVGSITGLATAGLAVATGGAALGAAAAYKMGSDAAGVPGDDPSVQGRARQLKAIAGYALGKSSLVGGVLEDVHEARTFARNFRTGGLGYNEPDTLDYMRVGQTLSGRGSSPWVAMGLSSSLRDAYDDIGGRGRRGGRAIAHDPDEMGEGEGSQRRAPGAAGNGAMSEPGELSRELQHLQATLQLLIQTLNRGLPAAPAAGSDAAPGGRKPSLLDRVRPPAADSAGSAAPSTAASMTTAAMTAASTTADSTTADSTTAASDPAVAANAAAAGPDAQPAAPNPASAAGRATAAGPTADAATDAAHGSDAATTAVPASTPAAAPAAASKGGKFASFADSSAPATPGRLVIGPPAANKEAIAQLLPAMAGSNAGATRAAQAEIAHSAGPQAAATVQAAVSQHGAANITLAIDATAQFIEQRAAQGATAEEVLQQFQSGAAAETIRQEAGVERLTEEQAAAIADLLLTPRRVLDREELVTAVAATLAQGYSGENALAAYIGSPAGFGGDTGSIRAVMDGAQAMSLSQADLARMARLIEDGLRHELRQELRQAGHNRTVVETFVSGLDSLPDALQVPQTAAFRPGDAAGFQRFTKKDVS
jgi:hypothetical protein